MYCILCLGFSLMFTTFLSQHLHCDFKQDELLIKKFTFRRNKYCQLLLCYRYFLSRISAYTLTQIRLDNATKLQCVKHILNFYVLQNINHFGGTAMKYGITTAVLLALTVLLGVGTTTVFANSAQSSWEGIYATGTIVADEDCPIIVERELLTFDISEFPQEPV